MRKWDELPKFMRTDEVKQYYDILIRHEKELRLKRYFDILLSMILLVILSPIMLVISIAIKLDSPGPVIYKQVRVTQYGKKISHSKVPYYGAECRQDGNTGYDQSGFQTDTGWKSDPWLQD